MVCWIRAFCLLLPGITPSSKVYKSGPHHGPNLFFLPILCSLKSSPAALHHPIPPSTYRHQSASHHLSLLYLPIPTMQPLLLLPLLALPALAQSTDGKSTAKAGIENTPVVFANLTNLDSALKITAECATKCYKDKFIGYNNAYDAGRCPITGDKKEVVDWYCTCEAWHADKTTRNPSAYKIVDERFENCMTTSNLQCGKTEAILSESSNALNDYKKLVTDGFMDFCVKKFPALKVNGKYSLSSFFFLSHTLLSAPSLHL